jgi:iron uptake system component EfeO
VLTNDGCAPDPATVAPGSTKFEIENQGASKVSEAELMSEDLSHVYGEKENITPGLSGSFTLDLAAGTYKMYCPGAKQDTWSFTVKGTATSNP